MMEIITYKSGTVPSGVYATVADVLHDAFQERTQQGIIFNCGNYTAKDVENELAANGGGYLLVAKDGNTIIGTLMLNFRRKGSSRYASHDNLAIASSHKGNGIAGLLFQEALRIAKDNNLDFINSFTATAAESSIRYHKKMGFLIYGKSFGKMRNAYSFIYPIRKYNVLRCLPIRKMVYLVNTTKSWIITKLYEI